MVTDHARVVNQYLDLHIRHMPVDERNVGEAMLKAARMPPDLFIDLHKDTLTAAVLDPRNDEISLTN